MSLFCQSVRGLVVAFALVLCFTPSVLAQTIIVTNLNDSGPGSFREAVTNAGPGVQIIIDPSVSSGTLNLATALPTINQEVTIVGNGLTINGQNSVRIFNVEAGNVTMERLTLINGSDVGSNGAAPGGGGDLGAGGAVFVDDGATLTLDTVIIQNNSAIGGEGAGGGLGGAAGDGLDGEGTFGAGGGTNSPGTAGALGGLSGNSGGGGGAALGGGVFVSEGGTLILVNPTVSGNSVVAGTGRSDGLDGTASGSGIFLHNSNLTVEVTDTRTISDVISDSSSVSGFSSMLTKTGSGTLILEAANTYTGATNVDQGTLRLGSSASLAGAANIASGATLAGTGTIAGSVTSAGNLDAGSGSGIIGTLNFQSDLSITGGSVAVDISDSGSTPGLDNDLYQVGGDLSISGGTVDVNATGANFSAGQRYTFLQFTGTRTGTFAGTTDNLPFFDALLFYETNAVELELQLTNASFQGIGQSCNQRTVGTLLDTLASPIPVTPSGPVDDISELINTLRLSTEDQIQRALDQISGQIYPTLAAAQLQQTSLQLSLLRDQLFWTLSEAEETTWRHAWVRGYGQGGDADSDDCGSRGFQQSLGGMELGFQRNVMRGLLIGGFANLGWSQLTMDDIRQSATTDAYLLGGSFQYVGQHAYVLGIGGGGVQNHDVQRQVDAAGLGLAATSTFDGEQTFGYLEQGTLWRFHDSLWMPFLGVQYIRAEQEAINEQGSAVIALAGDEIDAESLRGVLGLAVEQSNLTSLGRATARIRCGWMHEFLESRQQFTPTMDGQALGNIVGLDLGRDWAMVGAHLDWQFWQRVSFVAGYQGQVNDRQSLHTGAGGLMAQW